ncbi:MAG: methyltransferase domain-containing protein [Myxococcales bacterium]|nr:methyltransferase domain-containing protein [Myxococcales bacterium]
MTSLTSEELGYYRLNRRAWALLAPVYDSATAPFSRLRYIVAELVPLAAGARVLDVATGTGAQAFAFAEKAREVVGVDISPAMLKIARRKNHRTNVSFQESDATCLPFSDGSFDVTSVSFALHEMPVSIGERTVREMVRVTRPGGSVVIVDYALPQSPIGRFVAYHAIRLYEGRTYAAFVRADRAALLGRAGIAGVEHHAALWGVAAVTLGRKPLGSQEGS